VERSSILETTALGAATLAGVRVGLYPSFEAMAANWRCERRFEPVMSDYEREARYVGWRDAVGRVLGVRSAGLPAPLPPVVQPPSCGAAGCPLPPLPFTPMQETIILPEGMAPPGAGFPEACADGAIKSA